MEWIITQLNTMGEAFVRLALPMLVSSTALAALVLLVEFVLRASAPDKVIFDKLRDYLGTEDVMLASEDETRAIFPDCEEGAEPPL
ncbi:MAG: hypothetical protein M1376_08905, partial [Planctomycetes bacterium]|nr:hypothetical protein [Planctomycetota bacterium]